MADRCTEREHDNPQWFASTARSRGSPSAPWLYSRINLARDARIVGRVWKESPYFDEAEADIDVQWQELIWPFISGSDFTCVVDLLPATAATVRSFGTFRDDLHR